jgi:hypothetical protein
MRVFIRHLVLHAYVAVESLGSLMHIAEATLSFQNLQSVTVRVLGHPPRDLLEDVTATMAQPPAICFKTKTLIATYRHSCKMHDHFRFLDKMEMVLLPALSIITSEGRVLKKRWERWTTIKGADEDIEEYCDAWPESEAGLAGVRWTKKTVRL